MDRRHVIYGVVALGMLFSCAELIMILGSSDLVMLLAWGMSLYVDAVIAAWTAAVTRIKGFWHALKAHMLGAFRRSQRPRARRSQASVERPAANDSNEDGAGWSYALAA